MTLAPTLKGSPFPCPTMQYIPPVVLQLLNDPKVKFVEEVGPHLFVFMSVQNLVNMYTNASFSPSTYIIRTNTRHNIILQSRLTHQIGDWTKRSSVTILFVGAAVMTMMF